MQKDNKDLLKEQINKMLNKIESEETLKKTYYMVMFYFRNE